MKDIVFDGDGFPTGVSEGNPLPKSHPYSGLDAIDMMYRLRFADGNVKDISEHDGPFYINKHGNKHIKKNHQDWQELQCEWDDELVHEGSTWRVKTDVDINKELIEKTESRIDQIADVIYTRSVSRAARYERKREQALEYKDAGYPTPVDADLYTYIAQESSSRGITPQEMADLILLRADQFSEYGAKIDSIRATLINDILTAPDNTSKQQAAVTAIAVAEQETNILKTLIEST